MAFKMKGPFLYKSTMKLKNDDKNKKSSKVTRMDGLGNTEEDIIKAYKNKNKNKKKPKFTKKEISDYNKKLGIIPASKKN